MRQLYQKGIETEERDKSQLEEQALQFISKKRRNKVSCDWKNLIRKTCGIDNYNPNLWNTALKVAKEKSILNLGKRGSIFITEGNFNLNPSSSYGIRYYFEKLKEAEEYKEAKFPEKNNIRFAVLL